MKNECDKYYPDPDTDDIDPLMTVSSHYIDHINETNRLKSEYERMQKDDLKRMYEDLFAVTDPSVPSQNETKLYLMRNVLLVKHGLSDEDISELESNA